MHANTPVSRASAADLRARRLAAIAIDAGLFALLFAGLFLPFRHAEHQAAAAAAQTSVSQGDTEHEASKEIENLTRPFAIAFLALLMVCLPEAVQGQSLGKKAAGLALAPPETEHPFIKRLPLRLVVKLGCLGAPLIGLFSLSNAAFYAGCALFCAYGLSLSVYFFGGQASLLDRWLEIEVFKT